jgi:Gpi18-like mannosyltransferase
MTWPVVDRSLDGSRIVRRFFMMLVALTAVVAIAPSVMPSGHAPPRPRMAADWLLGNWLQWDGWWYLAIARHGYTYRPNHMSAVAYFPVYPLAVRAFAVVVPGGIPLAALLVTTASGLAALLLFHRWCARRLSRRAAFLAVTMLAVYPYSWFLYGTAYSDALFLALVIGAFLAVESDRPVLAGLLGAVATATRPTGIVLVIGLISVTLDRQGRLGGDRSRARFRRADSAVLFSVAGLIGWCAWLWIRFGNPFAFIETEGSRGWNQAPGWHTWLKLSFYDHVRRDPFTTSWPLVLQAVACIAFIAAVPAVSRRFGRGYGIYTLAAAVIPAVSTTDFMGVGRYLIPAFPVFALMGATIERRALVRTLVPAAGALALVAGTALFASGYYLT